MTKINGKEEYNFSSNEIEQNIHKLSQLGITEFSIHDEEIAKNKYDLSVNSYVEFEQAEEEIDIIETHRELAEKVERINQLRLLIDEITQELDGGIIE